MDDTGKTLAPSETLNGNVGDTYNATANKSTAIHYQLHQITHPEHSTQVAKQ
ncbi:MucBP domain-containing protein [Listeria monocytogenes]|uniref:MucBP domain-containing protein n=1 Tax=Listeria monocytogenes TaxID=1639 RepID=UPI00406BC86F